jgi:hypothetical protein
MSASEARELISITRAQEDHLRKLFEPAFVDGVIFYRRELLGQFDALLAEGKARAKGREATRIPSRTGQIESALFSNT